MYYRHRRAPGKGPALRAGSAVLWGSQSMRRALAGTAVLACAGAVLMPNPHLKATWVAMACLVPFAEAINEVAEILVDRVSKEWHPLSRDAKDVGSCLVPLAMMPLVAALALAAPGILQAGAEAPTARAYLARSFRIHAGGGSPGAGRDGLGRTASF